MPKIVTLAGANGAGKSTIAPYLLSQAEVFLNADDIAKELKAEGNPAPDFVAGRLLLQRLDELERTEQSFAVETTLATRSFAPRIERMQSRGYRFHLIFLYLSDAETTIQRVQERGRHGGHVIPETVIRRRYAAGLSNFINLYRLIASTWRIFENKNFQSPNLIALGSQTVKQDRLPKEIQQTWKQQNS